MSLKLAPFYDLSNEIRSSAFQALTSQNIDETAFADEELRLTLHESNQKYQGLLLRKRKSARKELFQSLSIL
jgi:hypothetical protein